MISSVGVKPHLKKNYRSGALLQSFKQETFTQTLPQSVVSWIP
jgi:hypothetical protein